MSLLDQAGYGCYVTRWTEDTVTFKAAVTFDNSLRKPQHEGMHRRGVDTTKLKRGEAADPSPFFYSSPL